MDVKAELVLLIFTLNCVTLILVGKDLTRSRLCRDTYAHDSVCIAKSINTPIILNDTTSTIAHIKNTTNTSLSDVISPQLSPPLQRSPHLQPQQQPRQLFSSLLSKGEEEQVEDSHALSSLLPPGEPKFNKSLTWRHEDRSSRHVNVTQAVESSGLILTATFVSTSVVSSQVLGRWIDRWSRKSMMMLPLTGVVLWATCGLMVSAAPWIPFFLWFVGAGLCGLCGGFITLKTAVTTYALQAMARGDKMVKLALLQAAISLGVFAAYLCSCYLPANTHGEITDTFLGPATRVNAHNSTLSLARHAQREEEQEEQRERRHAGKIKIRIVDVVKDDDECDEDEKKGERHVQRKVQEEMKMVAGVVEEEEEEEEEERNDGYHEERMVEAAKEEDDKCDESEEEEEEKEGERYVGDHEGGMTETAKGDDKCAENEKGERRNEKEAVGEYDRNEKKEVKEEKEEEEEDESLSGMKKNTQENSAIEPGEIDRDEGHLIAYSTEEEKPQGMKIKQIRLESHGSSPSHHTITIASEDGNSVYGTPPEPSSHYGTPPSRTLSRHSLEAAEGVHQQAASASHHPPQACVPCCCHHGMQEDHFYYRRPRDYSIGLSSSAPSALQSTINVRDHEAPHNFQNEIQFKHRLGGYSSQQDSLMSLNVLLTPDSSRCFTLSCEGSHPSCSSSSEGCRHCHDVLREDEGYNFGAYASLDDMQSLSLPVSSNSDTLSLSNNPSSITRHPEIPPTTQNESMGEVSEGAGDRSSAPLTLASESSGEGDCCAGGAGRCRVCVGGGLFCRPVSVTFRRRAAGLRGIVVADVVAAFVISVVAAAVWEVTPLYLEAKMKWSLADWIPYLACRSGLGVVALVVLLPLLRRWWVLQDTTLGVLGGISSFTSSTLLSFLTSSSAVIPLALISGPLAQYLNVASASILVRLVGVNELGGVMMCLCTIEQLGMITGLLTFHYIFPLMLRCKMPGVTFISTGLLVTVPSVILGVLYFSLNLRQRISPRGTPSRQPSSLGGQRSASQQRSRHSSELGRNKTHNVNTSRVPQLSVL
ncbi:hypothetical protein O3P69_014008 [Scylla paramamosain]|uniref:Uncharacterized protein n=1 Tax=Scylla paramamosain TaxID=85552 RepID=A0AAW0SRF2_SCYPA